MTNRDPQVECARLSDEYGVLPSAKAEMVSQKLFHASGDNLITDDGVTIEDHFKRLRESKPHYFPDIGLVEAAEAAFGARPTLKARGVFITRYGQAAYGRTAKEWGADASLRPGKAPGTADADDGGSKKLPAVKATTNPWSRDWRGTDAERHARMASIIKAMGAGAAAGMAKAAGATLSGTRLRK